MFIHRLHAAAAVFIGRGNGCVVHKRDLGVRDNAGKEKCVGGITETALYPADGQRDPAQGCLYKTGIAPMPHKAATAAAGALKLAGLDGIYGVIIRIL